MKSMEAYRTRVDSSLPKDGDEEIKHAGDSAYDHRRNSAENLFNLDLNTTNDLDDFELKSEEDVNDQDEDSLVHKLITSMEDF